MINNLAIVGLGSIGRKHLAIARELRPELYIVIIRSGNGESVEEEKFANKIYFSLEDAIDAGIQAAIIASPAVCHIQQAKKIMEAGIHTLVEKPLSHSLNNINERT